VADTAAPQTQQQPPSTRTATVVVADDRPLVRAGLQALVEGGEHLSLSECCDLSEMVSAVERHLPSVLVAAIRESDPDPFTQVARAKALHPALNILVITDGASVMDLREAIVAGVDSLLLFDAGVDEIVEGVIATARGERVVSPSIAMQLAGTWRHERGASTTSSLTPRELEVLQLLAEGMTNKEIGEHLGLSARTIKTHVQNLLGKLDSPDRTGAVARGFRMGLIR
jgi:DNA-binding NarL/FixJ family response regulator